MGGLGALLRNAQWLRSPLGPRSPYRVTVNFSRGGIESLR